MPQLHTTISSQVYYRKMGSGPALVLLHGFPESGNLWRNTWDELAKEFTLLIPDFPGAGQSLLESDTSIPQMADCVKQVMDNENVSSAVIAGHSMGGYVAFAFAAAWPERVMGLSLVHSTPAADDDEKKKMRLKTIDLILNGGKKAFISQMIPNLFSPSFRQSQPGIIQKQVEEGLLTGERSLVNFYKAMVERTDTTYLLDSALFPLQWVLGTEDSVISYKKILDKCHKSGINFVSFYNNCGHMSMFETPARLTEDLKAFGLYCYERHKVL